MKGLDNAAAEALSRIYVIFDELKEMYAKVVNIMTRAQVRRLADKDSSINMIPTALMPHQPGIVSTHIKPKESVDLR